MDFTHPDDFSSLLHVVKNITSKAKSQTFSWTELLFNLFYERYEKLENAEQPFKFSQIMKNL
jgi:hypothetical protein